MTWIMHRCRLAIAVCLGFAFMGSEAGAGGDAALGEYLSGQCTTCHQLSGKTSGIPAIVGWDEASFIAVLRSYRSKERDNQVMQNITAALSNDDIAALAAYFATIKPSDQ